MVKEYTSELQTRFRWVERAKLVSCGFIVEARLRATEDEQRARFQELAAYIWATFEEVLYSLYFFFTDEDRFVLEGVLRTTRTTYSFNMSTSALEANDLFALVPRFDFDQLTLGDYQGVPVLFRIATSSPSAKPVGKYVELDLQGHQFPVQSAPTTSGIGIYSVTVGAGLDMT
jgi:hypothetical protein